jgi:hypothetical protein
LSSIDGFLGSESVAKIIGDIEERMW